MAYEFYLPFIPTPTSASKIMPTSLLPSPTASTRQVALAAVQILAFWLGDTLATTTELCFAQSTN
jgi:hypothetical protein